VRIAARADLQTSRFQRTAEGATIVFMSAGAMILRLGTRVEAWDEVDFASYSKP
jgi:hypothetical protein